MVTHGQPFWWTDNAELTIKYAITFSVKNVTYSPTPQQSQKASRRVGLIQREISPQGQEALLTGNVEGEKLEVLFDTLYMIPGVEDTFRPGEAYLDMLVVYAVNLRQVMPNTIALLFEEQIEGPIKVIVTGNEPVMDMFNNKNAFTIVGPQNKFNIFTSTAKERANDTQVYIAILPTVST